MTPEQARLNWVATKDRLLSCDDAVMDVFFKDPSLLEVDDPKLTRVQSDFRKSKLWVEALFNTLHEEKR